MTSSSEHGSRIRRVAYEPVPADAPGVWVCRHCGGELQARDEAGPSARETAAAQAEVQLPDERAARREVARVVRLVLEVIDARRPLAQLDGIAAPAVLRYVRATRLAAHPARSSRLLSVRVCCPAVAVIEAAAVVRIEQRDRAVATRFEQRQGQWRCVSLRII
jgi:hypothetical protein